MADVFTPEQRSRVMAAITGRNTQPEIAVRRIVHALGYRFRLHGRTLPGRPDIVLAGRRAVLFVHGCFWHGHPNCRKARLPTTRVKFWTAKIDGNRRRDRRNAAALRRAGWRVLTVWECRLAAPDTLTARIREFLSRTRLRKRRTPPPPRVRPRRAPRGSGSAGP